MSLSSSLQTLAVTLVALIGIIVLIALKDLDSTVGIPIIAALAGVQVGSSLQTPAVAATPAPATAAVIQ